MVTQLHIKRRVREEPSLDVPGVVEDDLNIDIRGSLLDLGHVSAGLGQIHRNIANLNVGILALQHGKVLHKRRVRVCNDHHVAVLGGKSLSSGAVSRVYDALFYVIIPQATTHLSTIDKPYKAFEMTTVSERARGRAAQLTYDA